MMGAILGLVAVVLILVGVLYVVTKLDTTKKLKAEANKLARQNLVEREEIERQQALANKTEAIHADQINNRDRANTFTGSLDVLSDLSKRRSGR